MGVPKFFRYISERYPCLSEVVREYQIPEFDNLYLDMNGIIHMCSHPDDENVHFRITEEQIFKDIFHYIEVLFRMIRPQKLFFMAVDGVAPRAKMNQQRGRRFRSAKDVEKKEQEAAKKGEVMPTEARFDSNCITPGTVFMARLHEQLKYFVVEKISNDVMWQNCKVILSGHETPGEGEHKIMDYIRYMRAQPGYDPNTRHCLYGLDADLIMLGLCTHEPHFCLLREEVKFGKKSSKRATVPEEITFYLLHLSLMREYLELEFYDLKDSLKTFEFDVEKIIDDWVLMGFLVGNDFIPHLPDLHIINGALPLLYNIYMEVLPTLDGYINECGQLNLARFEKFMQKLSVFDFDNFEEVRDDLLYMEAKTGRKQTAHSKVSCKPPEDISNSLSSESRKSKDSGLAALIQEASDFADTCTEDEEEIDDTTDASEDEAFTNYKREYYQNKLEFDKVTPEVMRAQAEGYVRAIQWNLNYYYNGCSSWSWYYPHHYAPYISDIKGFTNLDLQFDLGRPFLPFEQLLAVLPAASKDLLPTCYHKLMTKEDSLIKQYYPEEFQTDLNGKKQEWEAVVLVPFIDENLLLQAMDQCNDNLSEEEANRNKHGPMLIYTYTPNNIGTYFAPQYFPPVIPNHANVRQMFYDEVLIPKDKLIKGAYPGAITNVYYPGFPTMKHLKYKGKLKKGQIKVFEHASRGENMFISILPTDKISSGDMIPVDLLGTSVFVRWPHLTEATVVAISNNKRKYVNMGQSQYNVVDQAESVFLKEIEGIQQFFKSRMGIDVGDTKILVYVQTLMGKKFTVNSNGNLVLEKQFAPITSCYPLQSLVYNIQSYEGYQTAYKEIEDIFPKNSICLTLTNPYYGSKGIIQENRFKETGRIKIIVTVQDEPDFTPVEEYRSRIGRNYKTLHTAASQLAISNNLFSRITGSIFVKVPGPEATSTSLNIGLDLKMNKKNLETPGYTKRIGSTWHYSDKTSHLVRDYCENFPEVFDYLRGDFSFEDINPETIFEENWEERLAELKNWLKSLPTYKIDRRICGSSVLEPEVVEQIEITVDNFKNNKIKNVTMQIKPSFLYRPEIQSGTLLPDPKMDVKIMDRIVNVRHGYSVPFGIKGTVTAIQESLTGSDRDTMYDIVFDTTFKDGMKLNCSERRGYRLPKYAFINISYGKRLLEQKVGKPDDVIAASQSRTTVNPHGNNHSQSKHGQRYYNPNQQQQFGQQNSAFAQFASLNISKTNDQYGNYYGGQNIYQQGPQDRQYKPTQLFNKADRQNDYRNNFQYNQPGKTNRPYSENPFMSNNSDSSSSSKKETFHSNGTPTANNWRDEQKNRPSTQSKQSKDAISSSSSTQEAQNRQQVNVDFLKNLLKINGSSNEQNKKKIPPQSENTNTIPAEKALNDVLSSTTNTTQNKEENLTVVSFDQLTQIANAPASVRLLTYYQSNGLGLPRYQYLKTPAGLQAQITLADGHLVIGKAAATREEASENVAKDVLDFFVKNKTPNHSNSSSNQSGSKIKSDTSAVLKNSFVPLQAIKSHINKTSKQSNQRMKENIQNSGSISEQRPANQKVTNTISTSQTKPKKERKTRIAANLFNKN